MFGGMLNVNYTWTVNSTIDYSKITDHLQSGVVYNFRCAYLSVHISVRK